MQQKLTEYQENLKEHRAVVKDHVRHLILLNPTLAWTSHKDRLEEVYRRTFPNDKASSESIHRYRRMLVFDEKIVILPDEEMEKSRKGSQLMLIEVTA